MWYSKGEKTSGGNVLLADSGPIGPGRYAFDVIICSTGASVVVFEHMDVAGVEVINSHVFYMLPFLPDRAQQAFYLDVGAGERVRLRSAGSVVGRLTGSILKR